MKHFLFFLIFLFCFVKSFSQKASNIWYFGNRAGINFNTSPPSSTNTSNQLYTVEGSATICDNNGNILFYTDGVNVWNRNNAIMPNGFGLTGSFSSTQSALIIPKPGDSSIYYIFTVPAVNVVTPLSYAVLDMTQDGGLGNIVSADIPLFHPVTESLTGTLQSNGVDYWVVTQEYGVNGFLAYSVTASGVNPVPVISYAGSTVLFPPAQAGTGYLKISPDGKKMCQANLIYIELFDFNNATGIVSNAISLPPLFINYGVEFSPDNSKLYVANSSNPFVIKQFDLLAGSPIAIQNSGVEIVHIDTGAEGGALKLGPDNKIYVARVNENFVAVINQPDLPGMASNYVDHGLDLDPNGPICKRGLPNNLNVFSGSTSCPLSSNINSDISICANQFYQLPSGASVSAAGIYNDTLKNQAGSCDSIINTIHLLVNVVSSSNVIDSIYDGTPYILPSGQTVNAPGVYQNILVNSLGCDSIVTTTLKPKSNLSCLVLKTAFTPNGDGINDYWVLYKDICFKKLEVNVYNRYGSLVYHADDYKNDWNGKYKNKSLPDGTYYYVIKATYFDGREQVFKNNVTIVR